MKRTRSEQEGNMEIVWQTPANPAQRQDYIFRDGIRYVRPYYFEFISHAKNRWAGKTVVDLFTDEFKGRLRDYYVSAVKAGRIQVDGKIVPISYVVQSSQKISHFLHRHEPPVVAMDVQILHTEPDVVTVCKPASVPVHPCGQYRKNTVVGILQAEHDLAPLFPIHRLDRLVSGLLILARTASKADIFRQQIECGEVKKQYIARVVGVFPENEQVANVNVNYNAREGKSTVEGPLTTVKFGGNEVRPNAQTRSSLQPLNGFVIVNFKSILESFKSKDNLRELYTQFAEIVENDSKGKAACTKFTRICTNGTESMVLCEPITGRTHQIRVHLQYLGHPIANDMLYLSEHVPNRSTEGTSADRAAANSALFPESDHTLPHSTDEAVEEFTIDPMCTNCPHLPPKGYDGREEGLWLHCVRYDGPNWTYECPYPHWASFT